MSPQNRGSLRTGAKLKLAPWLQFLKESKESKMASDDGEHGVAGGESGGLDTGL